MDQIKFFKVSKNFCHSSPSVGWEHWNPLKIFYFFLFFSTILCPLTSYSCPQFSNFPTNFYSINEYYSDTTIDVKYYDLFLDVKTNSSLLTGKTGIYFSVKSFSINSFFLDLNNNLSVDSIKLQNTFLNFNFSNNILNITLDRTYYRNENVSVIIYYHGTPVPTGFGSFIFGTHNSTPSIWSLSQPFGASDWFPCKNTPDDKSDSVSVKIKCPQNLIGVSQGNLIQVINNPDSTKTYCWKSHYPLSNYLISVAITNYTEYRNYFKYTLSDSMPVIHYIYPEHFQSAKQFLDKTPYMLNLFSNKFGLYPFINEKYGHAEFGKLAGMEHQTISSMGAFFDGIIAHELAHQWFGDKITCRNWRHIWLHEGFATFCEGLFLENFSGRTAYMDFIRAKMTEAKRATGTIYVQNDNNISEIFDANRSYSKGAVVLHMLRSITGDSLFFGIMKKYINDSSLAYKTAVISDFQRNAEQVYGFPLNYFFSEWIYGENYPKYIVNWSYSQSGPNTYIVHLNLKQQQNSNPQFFTMPVDIKITTSSGDTTANVFNNASEQNFDIQVTGKPEYIVLDPDNKILKDKTGDEPVTQVRYELAQNYPNPFNPSTTIEYEILNYEDVNVTIYDLLGRTIKVFVNGKQKPDRYKLTFNSSGLPSGIYFCRISTPNFTASIKMLLIK